MDGMVAWNVDSTTSLVPALDALSIPEFLKAQYSGQNEDLLQVILIRPELWSTISLGKIYPYFDFVSSVELTAHIHLSLANHSTEEMI